MVKSLTDRKEMMKMRDLWSRAQPKEGKDENGRLVVKSSTNKKARMKIGDLWSYSTTALLTRCPGMILGVKKNKSKNKILTWSPRYLYFEGINVVLFF